MARIWGIVLLVGFAGLLFALNRVRRQRPSFPRLLAEAAPGAVLVFLGIYQGGAGAGRQQLVSFLLVSIAVLYSVADYRFRAEPSSSSVSAEGLVLFLLGASWFGWATWFVLVLERPEIAVCMSSLACLGLTMVVSEGETMGRALRSARPRAPEKPRGGSGPVQSHLSKKIPPELSRPLIRSPNEPRSSAAPSVLGMIAKRRAALGYGPM